MEQIDQETIRPTVNATLGYGLIILGVFVMFLAFLQAYRVFTKQAQVPEIFHFAGVKVDIAQFAPKVDTSSALDAVREKLKAAGVDLPTSTTPQEIPSQEIEMIPAGVLNASVNVGFFMLFMGFIVNLGAKLADIGTKLVRPIYIKTKS